MNRKKEPKKSAILWTYSSHFYFSTTCPFPATLFLYTIDAV